MLPAPDPSGRTPALVYYLGLGINAIPLGVGQKEPYRSILGGQWKSFQTTRISQTQANAWVQLADPQHGVGLICGRISGGLVCLDADCEPFAAWLLDNRDHPLLHGHWLVETGSGKVHIWVRSRTVPRVHRWALRQGEKAGEVRGEGSYAAAPPSLHPSGQRYATRAGSPAHIQVIDDAEDLARRLVEAYLLTNPRDVPPPVSDTSKRILEPDAEQRADIASRVKAASFPRKVQDTLLKAGHQDVSSTYWAGLDSRSEIDFAIACAFIRKGWSADESEWVFAGSLLAANCYADKRRANHGYAYWKLTWDNATAQVNQQVAASRVATGANFKVTDAVQVGGYNARYQLTLETIGNPGGERLMRVRVATEELASEKGFALACMRALHWKPRFVAGQRGRDFEQFTEAVLNMVTDQINVAKEFTTSGWREALLERQLTLCADQVPFEAGAVSLGWVEDGVYYVLPDELFNALSARDRHMTNEQFMDCVMSAAEASEVAHRFPSGQVMRLLRIVPRPGRLVLSPAFLDADDDGS
jgi:hypothetical protein